MKKQATPAAMGSSLSCLDSTTGVKKEFKRLLEKDHYDNLEPVIIHPDDINIGSEFNRGYFSIHKKGQLKSKANKPVQVTQLQENDQAQSLVAEFMREAETMRELRHPHLTCLEGITVVDGRYSIISELPDIYDLKAYLNEQSEEEEIPIWQLTWFALQSARAMAYMEKHKVIHSGIRAHLCMLDKDLHLKLSRYAVRQELYKRYEDHSEKKAPSRLKRMPPETLTSGQFTLKSVVWTYGMFLWEIFTYGGEPFNSIKVESIKSHVVDEGQRPEIPESLSEASNEFMYDIIMVAKCWEKNKARRAKCIDLIEPIKEELSRQVNNCDDKTDILQLVKKDLKLSDDVFTE